MNKGILDLSLASTSIDNDEYVLLVFDDFGIAQTATSRSFIQSKFGKQVFLNYHRSFDLNTSNPAGTHNQLDISNFVPNYASTAIMQIFFYQFAGSGEFQVNALQKVATGVVNAVKVHTDSGFNNGHFLEVSAVGPAVAYKNHMVGAEIYAPIINGSIYLTVRTASLKYNEGNKDPAFPSYLNIRFTDNVYDMSNKETIYTQGDYEAKIYLHGYL